MHEVWGDTVGAFEVARMRSIIVAVVATVAIISPVQARDDLAATRVAPEIGSAGYSIAAEERRMTQKWLLVRFEVLGCRCDYPPMNSKPWTVGSRQMAGCFLGSKQSGGYSASR